MRYIFLYLILLVTALECRANPSINDNDLSVERQELLHIAKRLAASLDELRQIEKSKANQLGLPQNPLPYPQGGAMDRIVTIANWEGPLESLLKLIAERYHYQLTIIGRAPALPILVSISAENKTLGTVIQDADLQAGNGAYILVKEGAEPTLELRYVTATA